MHWLLFLAALFGALGLHIGTNVINEIYDVRHGIDSITSPRMSMAILKGRITERGAFITAWAGFLIAAMLGLYLLVNRGWPILVLGIIGFVGGYFYTAPPFQYKYRALGLPLVFVLMGPLIVLGAYFAVTGLFDARLLVVSLPVGLLVTAILHGNEWRDVAEDTRHGFTTLSAQVGRDAAHWIYVMLVLGAYVAVGVGVMVGTLPRLALLTLFSLPLMAWILRCAPRWVGRPGCTPPSAPCCWSAWSQGPCCNEAATGGARAGRHRVDGRLSGPKDAVLAADDGRGRQPRPLRAVDRPGVAAGATTLA